ncbi:MAG: radical SAM protein [Xanthomonadales bacterium]|nr:radical SAM protein [Xanthomonadales bacterium]
MSYSRHHIAFGPVPSRRLGNSLGINNVTTKTCSYACIYCQVGSTTQKCIDPQAFFSPAQIKDAVARRLRRLQKRGVEVDYLTFVADGEPTLDINLAESISGLCDFGIPIAVISNSSLMWREEVRTRLLKADLVSIKVDSLEEPKWRRINRPDPKLDFEIVMDGIRAFAADFQGTLISETMLLAGLNDSVESLRTIAEFIGDIEPQTAYLAVPTRPAAIEGVSGADETMLTYAHELFSARLANVELLAGHEPEDFIHTGKLRDDLLAITAVHPMREAAVRRFLTGDNADWSIVQNLISEGLLKTVEYEGERFYLRPVNHRVHCRRTEY